MVHVRFCERLRLKCLCLLDFSIVLPTFRINLTACSFHLLSFLVQNIVFFILSAFSMSPKGVLSVFFICPWVDIKNNS